MDILLKTFGNLVNYIKLYLKALRDILDMIHELYGNTQKRPILIKIIIYFQLIGNGEKKDLRQKNTICYPVGYANRHKSIGSVYNKKIIPYIDARKRIYLPLYIDMVQKQQHFIDLKNMEKNIFIVDMGGPKYKSIDHYKQKYNTDLGITANNTIDVTYDNMKILLNDDKHSFGHGYCIAMAFLDIDWKSM